MAYLRAADATGVRWSPYKAARRVAGHGRSAQPTPTPDLRTPAPNMMFRAPRRANSYSIDRHTYSAICADCNYLITDCSSQSVAVTCRRPIAK